MGKRPSLVESQLKLFNAHFEVWSPIFSAKPPLKKKALTGLRCFLGVSSFPKTTKMKNVGWKQVLPNEL